MDIGAIRDIVISILGGLIIIVVLGIIIGLIIAYRKTSKMVTTVTSSLRPVDRGLAYVRGLVQGLNESINIFKKGG